MTQAQGSSSSPSGLSYEVFLSFHGLDTREGFCDYLNTSLNKARVFVFRDDDELPIGEDIGQELLQALSHSKIYIPIFSKGYATSKWCLMELVQMFKCIGAGGKQKILPIFYYVTPGEVKHQTGSYGDAFSSHEKKWDDETVQEWRSALKVAGASKGREIVKTTNRKEGKLVDLVENKVLRVLKKDYLTVTDKLVGLDQRKEAIMDVIRASTRQTFIGIYGMGGTGKTTLAKAIYNQLSLSF
ncbi:hypothetical protein MLD38_006692 [Melastoma candidum]|uniref:Uncharacterized protein n=1 Tax=Melastoma candidum TaxID=119954 RepID=A0ACB9RX70_9MYRT|nr:hypothetical protein MLD38_006692 [Melastoma candidum]